MNELTERLITNIKQIKDLAVSTNGLAAIDENRLLMIIGLCLKAEKVYEQSEIVQEVLKDE